MKAALALIFLACIAGSMAEPQGLAAIAQQGQAAITAIVDAAKLQILGLVQQAVGQLSQIVGSFGGRLDFNFNDIINNFKPVLENLAQAALGQLLSGISGIFGRGAFGDVAAIFQNFLQEVQGSIVGIGQHMLNQGLGAVLGSLGGSRGIGDIFAGLSQQVSSVVSAAQTAASGVLAGLTAVGANLLETSKPHFQQLQEQLVGHGMNVLGSLSETINNLHGSITNGGR